MQASNSIGHVPLALGWLSSPSFVTRYKGGKRPRTSYVHDLLLPGTLVRSYHVVSWHSTRPHATILPNPEVP
jgi:hypothetical protein